MNQTPDNKENPKEAAGRAKVPLHLVPPAASREMALALGHGAAKYGEWNWRETHVNLMTYVGALKRHLDAIVSGEDADPESGLSHWAHALAGAAIVCDAMECGNLKDDRPGGKAGFISPYDSDFWVQERLGARPDTGEAERMAKVLSAQARVAAWLP